MTGDDEILVVVVNNILFFNNLPAAAVYWGPASCPTRTRLTIFFKKLQNRKQKNKYFKYTWQTAMSFWAFVGV